MNSLTTFPEPSSELSDPAALFVRYLGFYRGELVRRLRATNDQQARETRLASGWTPIQMLCHLVHMEQRWFVWGFLGKQVDDPWGDQVDGVWHVPGDVTVEQLLERLETGAAETERILTDHSLDATAASGGRFSDELPSLAWICFHVFSEYARHLGHLDIAVELLGGPTGEKD